MPTQDRLLRRKAREIRRLARLHGIRRVRVFGSRASGTAAGRSDVDLLVSLERNRDLLDLVSFKLDVERLLRREVDVVTERALSPWFRQTVLQEARAL